MTNCSFYTPEEIAEHKLLIPTDEDVEALLATLNNSPICGTLSSSQVTPNAFCTCSRNATGSSTGGCNLCQ